MGSLCRINLVPRDAVLHVGQELIVYTTPDHAPAEPESDVVEGEHMDDADGELEVEREVEIEADGEPAPVDG